jgi:3-hydroxyisobutyrate dehydrogenase
MSKPRVALIGLGLMGSGMARRLLGAGFPLTVYNRKAERATPLAAEGAHAAALPREAAARADVVLSMVADDAAARAVWLGEQGALAGVARGRVLVECSTVTLGWIEELAREAAAAGCELLDAPVTGSRTHAASGELSFLVGGSAAALDTARPVLAAMSRAIVHVGAPDTAPCSSSSTTSSVACRRPRWPRRSRSSRGAASTGPSPSTSSRTAPRAARW